MSAPIGELRPFPLGARLKWGAALGVFVGFMALLAWWAFEEYELPLLDLRQRLLAKKTAAVDQVAIVLIDNASLETLAADDPELRWPWPRELQAAMVKFFQRAGAKAVLFDVLFADPSRVGADDDRGLAAVIQEAGNVRLFAKLEPKIGTKAVAVEEPVLARSGVAVPEWRFATREGLERVLGPLPELAAASAGLAIGNVAIDRDGVLRRADLLLRSGEHLLPSIGLAAALGSSPSERSGTLDGRWLRVLGRDVPLERDGRLLVRHYGPENTFSIYSAASVVRSSGNLEEGKPQPGDLDPALFKDRVVIVGASIAGNEDLFVTPTSRRFFGPEFHATVCANLLGGEFLRRPPTLWRGALVVVLGIAAGLLAFALWRPLPAGLGSAGLIAGWLAVSLAVFPSGQALDIFFPAVAIAAGYGASVVVGYLKEGRHKREISRAFGQYLSPAVIRDLMRRPGGLRLGGEKRTISVFFSDLKGFSTFSESMAPEELVAFLNDYLGRMTDLIQERRGVVDKYIGDAVMAFWGAPEAMSDDATQACLAALEQREALDVLNREFRAHGKPELFFRAGLHRGEAVVGNMGSPRRFAYTAMGDTVNLASRLEGANKSFGTSIMISKAVRDAAGDAIVARRLGRVRVVGRGGAVEVFELVARAGEASPETLERIRAFDEALAKLESGDSCAAAADLERLLASGGDPAAEKLLAFARERTKSGSTWEGVFELGSK